MQGKLQLSERLLAPPPWRLFARSSTPVSAGPEPTENACPLALLVGGVRCLPSCVANGCGIDASACANGPGRTCHEKPTPGRRQKPFSEPQKQPFARTHTWAYASHQSPVASRRALVLAGHGPSIGVFLSVTQWPLPCHTSRVTLRAVRQVSRRSASR